MKCLNQVLENALSYGYFVGIVTFLIYILKAAIDFWFVTGLEKKLMSDYQKLRGFLSKLIITIIPNVLLTFIYTFASNSEIFTPQENINENIFFIAFLSLIFLLNIAFHLIVILIEKVLNLKSDYILSIKDEEWCIERITKNNLLLLVNKEKEYLLIDEWKDKKVKKVINKHTYTYQIYSNNSVWKKVIATSFFLLVISTFAFIYWYESNYSSLLLLAGCFTLLSTLILFGNKVEYKRDFA